MKKRYEFGGRTGNIILIILLPCIVYYLYFCLRFNGGDLIPSDITRKDLLRFGRSILPTARMALLYLVWLAIEVFLQASAPGKTVSGRPLSDGTCLPYKMNGLVSFLTTLFIIAALGIAGIFNPLELFNDLGALITVVIIFAFLMSLFLYFYGRRTEISAAGSGSALHDFFMGYALNPRIRGFDLKLFFESRPSLIGWIVLTFSFAYIQYAYYGFISLSMILVCLFQFIYVLDYFIHETAILSTMDVVHDRFGFMLCFGDTVWVPFTYSIQAYYLIDHVHRLPVWAAVLISLLFAGGYYIFRATNLQKHRFREDPERPIWGEKPEYIETTSRKKLLLSGFWGWARHFNYVGDILMATAWSLPCLFGSLVPYFYPIYFTALLVHRERRDHRRCAEAYGKDWEEYCRRVRSRILPGIY